MDPLSAETWRRLLRRAPADAGICPLYGPLLRPPIAPDGSFVLGRIAQSLDGCIAMASGASQWISGPADVVHTHRLRALFDAVVIGAGTVRADDPQLTTREVEGPSPVRIVLDTDRRLDARYRVFNDGPETLLCCASDASSGARVGNAEVLRLPRAGKGLNIAAVLTRLAERGLGRILVEGGGITVSRFLAARALDRLHVTVAPMLIGSGIPAFTLPQAASLAEVPRFEWSVHCIGADVLLDIPLSRA
jgi:diaminohydroxyphosphoribosylaminopyrimidine deaminase / 5-amino-6-(5-phosphoribosylamino)uracil reductase